MFGTLTVLGHQESRPQSFGKINSKPSSPLSRPDEYLRIKEVLYILYSELPLIWTPEMRPLLYSGHLKMSQSMQIYPWNEATPLIRTLWLSPRVLASNRLNCFALYTRRYLTSLEKAPHQSVEYTRLYPKGENWVCEVFTLDFYTMQVQWTPSNPATSLVDGWSDAHSPVVATGWERLFPFRIGKTKLVC